MRIGARGSDLAQWQARWVGDRLTDAGIEVEQVIIRTHGDRVVDRPLRDLGVQGVFTKEIEEALLEEKVDLAVHSFKDMALDQPDGLEVVALSERADPGELLIIRRDRLAKGQGDVPLAPGAVVGTSAVRRSSQLLALRPDLEIRDLRGNVPTRLDKLGQGPYDAIFLAAAGVQRLGLDLGDHHGLALDPWAFIPSPAQGVLAVEMRSTDPHIDRVVAAIHHEPSAAASRAEREVLRQFGGGCSLPLGAFARPDGSGWRMKGYWGGEEGARWAEVSGDRPEILAGELARRLRGQDS